MNNFTKEYIAECDCESIQGLRPKLEHGDWYYHINEIYLVRNGYNEFFNRIVRKNTTWLPTGDALDEEIIKKCTERFGYGNWNYQSNHGYDCKNKFRYYNLIANDSDMPIIGDWMTPYFNPLIAKIKLLKQLFKEQP